jgi:hypothetical protein
MATSVVSSPVRSTGTGSPGFRSQRKMSAGTIVKKIQTLEDAIESLRQQLVFTRSEEESIPHKETKKPKEAKQQKETKEPKETKQKKTQESKEEEKEKIPMPWIGQADFTTCVGLKAQYGLFIQCGKTCDMKTASFQIDNHECRFCNDCSKKCDEDGKHPVGTVEERIEAGVGKYVNAKTGKKETMYIEVIEKMGITKEQALESAQRRGFQIPDWMLEKAEKKRGRPATATTAATTATTTAAATDVDTQDETKTNETKNSKEKKPRQPRAKATTKATTTKKTAKASAATQDTPQKKNSAQSSICIDLNNDDETVTPVADASVADVAAAPPAAPQEKEKKKRGRPTKSNTQNNVGESEMQQLIAQATTEKKKRLSLDVAADAHTSEEGDRIQVETQLTFEENGKQEEEQIGEDEIFEMFDKMLENEEQQQEQQEEQQEQQQQQQQQPAVIAINEKKDKSKKTKKSDDKEKVEKVEKAEKKKDDKVSKKEAAALKKKAEEEAALKKKAEEEAALKKKAEEEAALKKKAEEEAAKKKAQEEDDNETEDEEDGSSNEEEEEELECEEYEYDGETYGLAPNGDIYSQDGDLVGKLTNGVPKMFN